MALGGDCAGFISDAPDFRVFLTAGAAAIFISVVSDGDTTLVVNDPAGDWLCADDTGTSFNPQVRLDQAAAGQYDIWVGNYDSQGLVDATLQIGTRPIVAAGTSGKPTQPATVAQDDGGPFVELGTYRDWAVTRNNLSCFAYTVPTSVTPRNAGNDESFFTIIVGQGERFGYPSFVFSFDPNPDYFVTVRIDGGATFDFDPDDNFAYLSNPRRDEALIIAALQNGVAMEVVSVTPSGQTRTERYSLLGVTAALARATEACR